MKLFICLFVVCSSWLATVDSRYLGYHSSEEEFWKPFRPDLNDYSSEELWINTDVFGNGGPFYNGNGYAGRDMGANWFNFNGFGHERNNPTTERPDANQDAGRDLGTDGVSNKGFGPERVSTTGRPDANGYSGSHWYTNENAYWDPIWGTNGLNQNGFGQESDIPAANQPDVNGNTGSYWYSNGNAFWDPFGSTNWNGFEPASDIPAANQPDVNGNTGSHWYSNGNTFWDPFWGTNWFNQNGFGQESDIPAANQPGANGDDGPLWNPFWDQNGPKDHVGFAGEENESTTGLPKGNGDGGENLATDFGSQMDFENDRTEVTTELPLAIVGTGTDFVTDQGSQMDFENDRTEVTTQLPPAVVETGRELGTDQGNEIDFDHGIVEATTQQADLDTDQMIEISFGENGKALIPVRADTAYIVDENDDFENEFALFTLE